MKKTIQPISIWHNGIQKEARLFSIDRVEFNLKDSATCRYSLFTEDHEVLISRQRASLTSEQYESWGLEDSYFIDSIASNLGIVITGNYVEPTPEVIEQPILEEEIQNGEE
jgi:hypothetical protein